MHGSEAVSISLSTLGNQGSSRTPSSRELSEEASSIQKEIIKQLLYMADPRELPRSRFNRLHKAGLRRSLRTPSFISLILMALLLTGSSCQAVVSRAETTHWAAPSATVRTQAKTATPATATTLAWARTAS